MRGIAKAVTKRAIHNSCEHGVVKGVAKTGGECVLSVLGILAVFMILILMMAS